MKKLKLFTMLLLASLCLTGCGEKDIKLDLEKINEEVPSAKGNSLYVLGTTDEVEGENPLLTDLESVYYISDIFDIDMNAANSAVIRMNKENYDMYIVIDPEDSQKEAIQDAAKKYFTSLEENKELSEEVRTKIKNRLEKEYQGALIYVVSDKNEEVYNAIIRSKESVFNMLMDIDDEMLTSKFNIATSDVEEYIGKLPGMNINANMYLIIKPKDGKKQVIKDAMADYMKKLEDTFRNYSAGQAEIVEGRMEKELGGYLIYIVSRDNDTVYNIIKNNQISE